MPTVAELEAALARAQVAQIQAELRVAQERGEQNPESSAHPESRHATPSTSSGSSRKRSLSAVESDEEPDMPPAKRVKPTSTLSTSTGSHSSHAPRGIDWRKREVSEVPADFIQARPRGNVDSYQDSVWALDENREGFLEFTRFCRDICKDHAVPGLKWLEQSTTTRNALIAMIKQEYPIQGQHKNDWHTTVIVSTYLRNTLKSTGRDNGTSTTSKRSSARPPPRLKKGTTSAQPRTAINSSKPSPPSSTPSNNVPAATDHGLSAGSSPEPASAPVPAAQKSGSDPKRRKLTAPPRPERDMEFDDVSDSEDHQDAETHDESPQVAQSDPGAEQDDGEQETPIDSSAVAGRPPKPLTAKQLKKAATDAAKQVNAQKKQVAAPKGRKNQSSASTDPIPVLRPTTRRQKASETT